MLLLLLMVLRLHWLLAYIMYYDSWRSTVDLGQGSANPGKRTKSVQMFKCSNFVCNVFRQPTNCFNYSQWDLTKKIFEQRYWGRYHYLSRDDHCLYKYPAGVTITILHKCQNTRTLKRMRKVVYCDAYMFHFKPNYSKTVEISCDCSALLNTNSTHTCTICLSTRPSIIIQKSRLITL